MNGTNERVFAIACAHLPQQEMQQAIAKKFLEVTGGHIPIYSPGPEFSKDELNKLGKNAYVFMSLNQQLNPEVLITDDIDFTEFVVVDTSGLFLQPDLTVERNAAIAVQGLIRYLKEKHNG